MNAGHAHADALSLTLGRGPVPVLIDPGTGSYTFDARLRDRFRSTAMHNTLLGALLTIAPTAWYSSYEGTAFRLKLDAVADQQLAGLIMWVPSGVIFLVVGLALAAAWLGDSEKRVALGSTTAGAHDAP